MIDKRKIVESVRELPKLPKFAYEIQELEANGQLDIKTLIKIVEKDPMLTAELLKKINSGFYSFKNEIVSVQQVVTLLGIDVVKSMIIYMAIQETLNVKTLYSYGITLERFYEISQIKSSFVFHWTMMTNMESSKILVPVSFLSQVGKFILSREIIGTGYEQYFRDTIKEIYQTEKVEEFFFNSASEEITYYMFEAWGISKLLTDFLKMLYTNKYDEMYKEDIGKLRIAALLVNENGIFKDQTVKDMEKECLYYGLDQEKMKRAIKATKRKYKID